MAFLLFVSVKEPQRKEIYINDERLLENAEESSSNDDLEELPEAQTLEATVKVEHGQLHDWDIP